MAGKDQGHYSELFFLDFQPQPQKIAGCSNPEKAG